MNLIKKSNFNLFFLFLFLFYLNILNCKKKNIVKRKSKSLNDRNYFKNKKKIVKRKSKSLNARNSFKKKKNIGKKNINKKALYLKSLHSLHSNNNQIKESEKKELRNQKVQEKSQISEDKLKLKMVSLEYYKQQYDKAEDQNLIIYALKELTRKLLIKQQKNEYTKHLNGVQPCYLESMIVLAVIYKRCQNKGTVDVIVDKFVSSDLANFILGGGQISFQLIIGADLVFDQESKKLCDEIYKRKKTFQILSTDPNSINLIEMQIGDNIENEMSIGLITNLSGHYVAIVFGNVIPDSSINKYKFFNYIRQNYSNQDKSFVYCFLSEEEIYKILDFKYDLDLVDFYLETRDKYLLFTGNKKYLKKIANTSGRYKNLFNNVWFKE
jgi:hypothetical protein